MPFDLLPMGEGAITVCLTENIEVCSFMVLTENEFDEAVGVFVPENVIQGIGTIFYRNSLMKENGNAGHASALKI